MKDLNERHDTTEVLEWGKVFADNMTEGGLVSKLYKDLIKLNIKKQRTQSKKLIVKKTWLTFFQRKYTDDQQAQEKMLNTANRF